MDNAEILATLIKKVAGNKPNLPIAGKVVEVEKQSCKVALDDGLELTEVRLNAAINELETKYTIFPKLGSRVLMTSLTGGLDGLVIIKTDEVEAIEWRTEQGLFRMDSNGFVMNKGSDKLAELVDELLASILRMVFTTNQGPTIKLVNQADFEALKTKFKNLLKAS